MTETRKPSSTDRVEDSVDEGAREQGVRTEHPEDLSSPQMTAPVEDEAPNS